MPVMVITGASAGIGRAVAERALAAGWQVAGLSRREKAPDGALAIACDVTDPRAVETAFDQVVTELGRIDVLFANAGVFPKSGLIDEIADDDWRQAVAVNLDGMFFACRAAFARMRAQDPQGGRIILNGSVSAQAPRPRAAGYTVPKHALSGLTKQIALDGRAFNIAAGQIDIGNAQTELADQIGKGVPQADGSVRAEPMMPVAEAAEAVLRMADLPAGTNVLQMTIMASAMPLVGRG
ncbi:SDR family oxidoreductase [Paracoccus sp. TK19116]|uniref:SDR family oxidoreductase n=1 Tax=Paracoccus albicereus TaxID=2922394 RepID=A0ABT1MSZ4_9RHOB|nr:SDR family oxidoreductase [Paracoccus albicereus]MCQ0971306.1 SDR family oxidoreductase [Paracoccus albicereus]